MSRVNSILKSLRSLHVTCSRTSVASQETFELKIGLNTYVNFIVPAYCVWWGFKRPYRNKKQKRIGAWRMQLGM